MQLCITNFKLFLGQGSLSFRAYIYLRLIQTTCFSGSEVDQLPYPASLWILLLAILQAQICFLQGGEPG